MGNKRMDIKLIVEKSKPGPAFCTKFVDINEKVFVNFLE